MPATRIAALGAALLLALPLCAEELTVEVATPLDGDRLSSEQEEVMVSGRAFLSDGDRRALDMVFVLDSSGSTKQPSGIDVDQDGSVGRLLIPIFGLSTDGQDSVLAAEVLAAHTLIEKLDPTITRVGIVSFGTDTWADSPLTHDFEQVRRALKTVLNRGPCPPR